jgi:hypothetical protein
VTPPRRWEIDLGGHRHSVAFSPSITSARPNQIKVDGHDVDIDWHAGPSRVGRGPSEFEASFGIDGGRAGLRWYHSPHESTWTSRLATALGIVVAVLLGDTGQVGDNTEDGDVSLSVGGRLVPPRP